MIQCTRRDDGGYNIKDRTGATIGYVDGNEKLFGIGFDGYAVEIKSVDSWMEALKCLQEWRKAREVFPSQ